MKDGKGTFNVLASIERHVQALKPLIPKQAIVCVGEYPIKTLLKDPRLSREGTLPVFVEKSSDDIYKWIPKGYEAHFVLGFEDAGIDTHFWYDVLPAITKDSSLMDSLKKKAAEKLRGAIIFSSVWDGVGSAAMPSLIGKFRAQTIDSLSIAILPSKIQPADAHFNAYATLQMCLATEGSTVLLLGRDQLESYDGVDRVGAQIKGNQVVNYLLNLFLAKESLVQEIAELSRTFNVKLFSALAVTAASYQVYGSIENMLNTALLKPLSNFNLSSSKLLYVLLRMPAHLKDKIPRVKIELAITNWFKERTNPQSIHITEPIYTEDLSDRIDAVLFIGGFDTTEMFAEFEKKVETLKNTAIEKGYMTEDWQLPFKVEEEPKAPEIPAPPPPEPLQTLEEIEATSEAPAQAIKTQPELPVIEENAVETKASEAPIAEPIEAAKAEKPKRTRRTKKAEAEIKETPQPPSEATTEPVEAPNPEKPKRAGRTKKAQTKQNAE